MPRRIAGGVACLLVAALGSAVAGCSSRSTGSVAVTSTVAPSTIASTTTQPVGAGTTSIPPVHVRRRHGAGPLCGWRARPPAYRHFIVIVMENNSFGTIFGNPSAGYITRLAHDCGYAADFHNISHPSLPNYIALTGGTGLAGLSGFEGDCSPSPSCQSSSDNIFSELAKKGGWKAFDESMPAPCFKLATPLYGPKHNPAVYYTDLPASACDANDVPLGSPPDSPLLLALGNPATAPAFSVVTPNICDDMHGGPGCPSDLIATGDAWLARWVPLITATRAYQAGDTAMFVVWDEGNGGAAGEACATYSAYSTDESCRVLAIWVAPSVRPHTVVTVPLNDYSYLRTIEDLLRVRELGASRTAPSMAALFNL